MRGFKLQQRHGPKITSEFSTRTYLKHYKSTTTKNRLHARSDNHAKTNNKHPHPSLPSNQKNHSSYSVISTRNSLPAISNIGVQTPCTLGVRVTTGRVNFVIFRPLLSFKRRNTSSTSRVPSTFLTQMVLSHPDTYVPRT
mmetsp:Transcript_10068/g.12434  ORF Transcript_10068/g.12434 Transcript_10068/m.12434 type:complete len:140 (-) Transcript_10068:335-754(-)